MITGNEFARLSGGAAIIIALTAFWYVERYSLRVKHYGVDISGLPENLAGFTILQITDLHSKWFGKNQKRLIKLIDQQRYDLVVLTGDFINKFRPDIKPAVSLIKHLRDKPVYFVPGNHEWDKGFQYRSELLDLGVRILENKAEKFSRSGESMWIIGVDDPHTGHDRLDEAAHDINDKSPRILLAHSPVIFPQAVDRGIDLVIAGHAHGGQVRLPFIGALIVPGQGLFPKWHYGEYRSGKTVMIVSAGLGESDLPVRFNIKPEIVLITFLQRG